MADANANMGATDGADGDGEVFDDSKGRGVIKEKESTFSDDDIFDSEDDVEEEFFNDKDYELK
jgi:hypothetical protein